MTNLMHKLLIHLLQSSTHTCFEQYLAHPQEVKLHLIQHLVSSLSVSVRLVHMLTCAPDGHLMTVTIPDAVLTQFDLLRMSKILLETCTYRGVQ